MADNANDRTGFANTAFRSFRRLARFLGVAAALLAVPATTAMAQSVTISANPTTFNVAGDTISFSYVLDPGPSYHITGIDAATTAIYEGLVDALRDAGLTIAVKAIAEAPSSVGVGKEMTARLCAHEPRLDVVVYSNDDMAVGGIFHCMGANITIPDQLAIFGFNGLDIGRELPQPLSTIRSNRFLIGRTAVEKAFESAQRPPEPSVIDTGFEVFTGATA